MGRVGVHAGPRAWGQLVPHRLPGMVGISKILDTARDTIPYCCCHTDQALALPQTMISSIISASIALYTSRAALGGWGCCPAASAWLFLLFSCLLGGIKILQHFQTNSCSSSSRSQLMGSFLESFISCEQPQNLYIEFLQNCLLAKIVEADIWQSS